MTRKRGLLLMILVAFALPPVAGYCQNSSKPAQAKREEKHWAFRPVKRPAIPATKDTAWLRTPIDAFILAGLELKELRPGPAADKRTLLRRVYLDLVGLPPNPREIKSFLEDDSPQAFRKVVDDLLARPQYGERWARHWLDVSRYAETNGYERDGSRKFAWRYRDYVIEAFNQDKPYDRFVLEQIAGDELPGSDAQTRIATTFLRLGTWDDEPADLFTDRYDQLDDVLGTTASAFLGVTLRCARCHDHKFEPFTQKDYYSMLAVFQPLQRPQIGRAELYPLVGREDELEAHALLVGKIDTYLAPLQNRVAQWEERQAERLFAAIYAGAQTDLSHEETDALKTSVEKRTAAQKALVKSSSHRYRGELLASATADDKAELAAMERQIAALKQIRSREPIRAYVWSEKNKVDETHVLHRGDPTKPRGVVSPGLPEVLVSKQPVPPQPVRTSSGRRLWLARWLTQPDNPLTARVMVNRIWQGHFGEGIVPTANDLGVNGEPPSNSELLDWLASEFVASGWSVKHLHRLIVLSNTYQMASTWQNEAARVDPGNKLHWRWKPRRLEAEAVRDSILSVSGQLNLQMGGPSMFPPLPVAVLQGQSRPGSGWGLSDPNQYSRRSIYIFVKRSLPVPELELLDAPDTTCSCEKRPVSTTAPQALTFLNGAFIQQQARHFADRLRREADSNPDGLVRKAFELALCRPSLENELQLSLDFLQRHSLESLCLVLLNTNEFAYLD
jgi:hypothetical protein